MAGGCAGGTGQKGVTYGMVGLKSFGLKVMVVDLDQPVNKRAAQVR